ncbi:transmembrane protein, putative (macronuclear) [Tetrahymena thermophila SB210]|uniref:Transmembrane protein, putative n=1 Tax=Tetrahymena thermophila (strain SB210) TaxID=312017 RepID=W7XB49_TETTS|nr:transmembrane protein, putative [Tetrahymena thermophila SB210]EWS73643.1 transmembrane protein, putative [Tetrahymena thermophila SB210]|eukprot:XP_012653821.1 transmembrane protein, putative [Tetrahymena thermophila SB210]
MHWQKTYVRQTLDMRRTNEYQQSFLALDSTLSLPKVCIIFNPPFFFLILHSYFISLSIYLFIYLFVCISIYLSSPPIFNLPNANLILSNFSSFLFLTLNIITYTTINLLIDQLIQLSHLELVPSSSKPQFLSSQKQMNNFHTQISYFLSLLHSLFLCTKSLTQFSKQRITQKTNSKHSKKIKLIFFHNFSLVIFNF